MITELAALWTQAFGDSPEFVEKFFQTGFSPNRCRYIQKEGSIAAALYWFDCTAGDRHLAYIYAVATAKAYRGRGLCRRLMEHTHDHLQSLGYDGAVLVPGEPGLFSLYEKLGYRCFSGQKAVSCVLEHTEPSPVRRVTAEEYAALRRRYLPEGAVVQEGAALCYLESYCPLYAGEDFVYGGGEFLGNTHRLPGIAAALGKDITCRIPGTDPFAMYLPLSQKGQTFPTYFGLALD